MMDDAPIPEPAEGQVLVKCSHIGLCGSNMGQYTGVGLWADIDFPNPLGWAGHENVGTIVESRCPEWEPGTLVLAQPEGYYGFAEYIVAQPPAIATLPQDCPNPASMIVAQPLSTVLRAMAQTGHVIGNRCAVIGQGPMGLTFTKFLRLLGASEVIAVDPLDWRLEWGKKYGAKHVIDSSQQDVVETVRELTGGEMCDFVVEVVGKPESLATAALLPRRGGRLFVFGMPDYKTQDFPWYETFRNEVQINTCVGPECGDYFQASVDMMVDGLCDDLADMVTPIMPWDKAPEAFEMYAEPAKDSLKLTLEL